ncbi:hemolysin III family protein [Bacillus luteolus]|uniref:Hemolysin III family protein n=1 Tax=Litchfieldia luteola TaxID=682179 RepID=A0ABR9QNQ4_9BACI|nr:hemolysin III family protein [Cytobacillus luteolus]MBE4910140.1 hemolysin III family protein [Cytobacillus luteolus]MBP1942296.1 hemolysin III [Cytobacillus luteolus]
MEYTIKEEIANAITHGIGVLLSIPALVMLIIFAVRYGDAWHVVSFSIFGATMILLYLFSTLTHSLTHRKAKYIFEILDHSAIYLLIAGTYTPFLLVTLRGAFGWTMFGIIWGLAIVGIILKVFFVKRFIILSTVFYILMGWMIIIAIKPLYQSLSAEGFMLLLIGGLLYTVGSIFYVWRKIPYHHAIWHGFVLAGSAAMFFCVLFYVTDVPFV